VDLDLNFDLAIGGLVTSLPFVNVDFTGGPLTTSVAMASTTATVSKLTSRPANNTSSTEQSKGDRRLAQVQTCINICQLSSDNDRSN